MDVVAWLSIAPDDGSGSYCKYVAEAVALLDQTGLKYKLGAMGTEIEGPRSKVFDAIVKCHELMASRPGVRRVETIVKIDDRLGAAAGELERKVESVRQKRTSDKG